MERLKCQHSQCELEAKEQWWIKFDTGMVERIFCWNHANEYRPSDISAFGDKYVAGSGEGE